MWVHSGWTMAGGEFYYGNNTCRYKIQRRRHEEQQCMQGGNPYKGEPQSQQREQDVHPPAARMGESQTSCHLRITEGVGLVSLAVICNLFISISIIRVLERSAVRARLSVVDGLRVGATRG